MVNNKFFVFLFYIYSAQGKLWPKGVVHYVIETKDYDLHSQDVIQQVFAGMERELCVKFFQAGNRTHGPDDMLLRVRNPDQLADCPPRIYDYSTNIVEMPIGYKCLNTKEIARIAVDMLRASIDQSESINSYDMLKKFHEKEHSADTLLTPADRNFINSNYYAECGALSARPFLVPSRRSNNDAEQQAITPETVQYYQDKLWPLGVVMYSVEPGLRGNPLHTSLKFAMTTIELVSCVVFQFHAGEDVLAPKNALHFSSSGNDVPEYGFTEGNQTLKLSSMIYGAPGHTAHTLNYLLRILGVPMMSNRYDRDNYVAINWKNVQKGKEHLLEKTPEVAWVQSIGYDFDSATHAPPNFACAARLCRLGAATVTPIHDPLWQRSLRAGHRTSLSDSDVKLLSILYGRECQRRLQ